MTPKARIGLIIPSSNRLTEPQFQKYAPPGVGVHVTRLRMTGKWRKPLAELREPLAEAAAALSDTKPGVIVFHCTATSMEAGLEGEAMLVEAIQKAARCLATTTGQAVTQALRALGAKNLVLITPYVAELNRYEIRYLGEAGFKVVHDFGMGLDGGDAYINVTAEEWKQIATENQRSEADAYFLSCTNTTMIEVIDELERELEKPVVTSNQATLWACLRKLGLSQTIPGLGKLFSSGASPSNP